MSPPPSVDDAGLAERVGQEVARTLQRSLRGLDYLTTADPVVAVTPKETLYRRGTLQLEHYLPQTDEVYRVPLLLVMSLVSRPYILDLAPGQSLIEYLVEHGFDVYLIDWGVPRPEDRHLRLEDYVLDFLPDCLEQVARDSGEPDVSLVGYCMGGLLSLLYCALDEQSAARNLACFTTPVNFDGMTLFKRWTHPDHFDVDRIVDTLGNVPPSLLYASFAMLRPASPAAARIRLWDNMRNDEFVASYRRFDRWTNDQIPFPGECFRQTIKELQQGNKLIQGELRLAGRTIDLANVRVPLLHVVAEHDHIVPYAAARDLVPAVGSADKREIVLKGGHVSLVAGGNAVRRLWPTLDAWLAERSL